MCGNRWGEPKGLSGLLVGSFHHLLGVHWTFPKALDADTDPARDDDVPGAAQAAGEVHDVLDRADHA
jgi:hypothetical protein